MARTFGLRRLLHDIRYHRDRFRQFLGITFVILVSIAGEPKKMLFVAGGALVIMGIAARLWASGHIKKNKVLATARRAVIVNHLKRQAHQSFSVLSGVGYGCRTADELGGGTIKVTQTAQAAQHTGNMGTKNTAIGVSFIYHHIPQVAQKP